MGKNYSRWITAWVVAVAALAGGNRAPAQYYELANQLPNLLSPALSGSMNYKGYVDVTGTMGVGDDRINMVGISTTQGFQYSTWFFMGAGIGVDLAMSSGERDMYVGAPPLPAMSKTRVMLPVFSDFRFNLGSATSASFFIDIKVGATWLLGSEYLQLNTGALTNRTQFLLRPSIGLRIPTSSDNPKQALNIGATYQLITANNSWGYWGGYYSPTLNSLGLTLGYEW